MFLIHVFIPELPVPYNSANIFRLTFSLYNPIQCIIIRLGLKLISAGGGYINEKEQITPADNWNSFNFSYRNHTYY